MMQMEGNGGCCIARWTDGGHVASGYDVSKMDEIMLKFRPIAPKPMAGNLSADADGSSNNSSPRDGRHGKAPVRARRKNNGNNKKESNNNNNNNGKKRKSSSPDTPHLDHGDDDHRQQGQEQKVGVTLLPLFPEAPDLSPKNEANNTSNSSPIIQYGLTNFNDNCQQYPYA